MILFLWALSVQQGTTCICEDIAYAAMNPLQQHAERLTDGCCSAFQRSGWRGGHGAKQKDARWASQTSWAATHSSPVTTTTSAAATAAAAAVGAAGVPASCHSAASSTSHTASAHHTEPVRPREREGPPPRAREKEAGSGEMIFLGLTLLGSVGVLSYVKQKVVNCLNINNNGCSLLSLQMAATIDMNFQSDLMAIFEENLFWEEEQLKQNCKKERKKKEREKKDVNLL